MTTRERDHRADALLLMSCSFAVATSNSVIFAALGDLQDTYGFPDSGLGLIAGSGFLAGLLVQLFVSPFADRGHTKRLIMGGMLLGALGSLLMAFGTGLPQFVLARAVIGSAFGFVFPAVRALISHVDPERRGERLGRLAGVELFGFVAGPLFGGLLIDPIGLRSVFLLFGFLNLVAMFAMSFRSFPQLPKSNDSRKPSLELLRYPRVRIAVIVAMAIQAPVGIFDALWDRYLTDLGGGNSIVGISFALYAVPFFIFSAFGGRLADKYDPQKISLWMMILVVPAVTGYGAFGTLTPVILLNVFEGVAQALMYPSSAAAVAKAAPHGRASAAQGLAGASGLLMSMTLAFSTPSIYGRFGALAAFGAVGLLMTVLTGSAALMLWRLNRREQLN
jgi:MFS family permease